MGRRELALIVGFIVAGVLVWQVTAPEAEGPGFSIGGWLSEIRREMRGRRASAEVTTNPAIPIDESVAELRLTLSGDVTITGEDRADVAAELKVISDGFDEAEARKLAADTALKVERFADSVVVAWKFPDPGRQVPRLTLRVPSRLRIQLEGRGSAAISGVGSVTLARTIGTIKIENVPGLVKGDPRGGSLTIDGANAIDLALVGGETALRNVRADVRLNVRGGQVRLDRANARATMTGNDARIRVDSVAGEVRAEVVEGDLELNDVGAPVDIDARDTAVTLGWLRPSAAKVQVRDGSLDLTLPKDAASYSLDVRATRGELRVPDTLQKTTEGEDAAVRKTAGANAPSIFVRGVASTITIR